MPDLLEIRWHGRGGQGAVTAAKLLAQSVLSQGKYFQAFPEYGPERMGAPIQAFNRVSPEPINLRCSVTQPNIVIVLDPTLLFAVDVTEGISEDGVLLINTSQTPAEVRKQLNISGRRIFTVDASQIALDCIGKPIPNTPMLGALLKASGLMKLKDLTDHLRDVFGKKFSSQIVEGNVKAVERAYEEVKGQ